MAKNGKRKGARAYTPAKRRNQAANGTGVSQMPEKAIVCNSIEVLTLDKFIKCMVNNDLSVLRMQGIPSDNELFNAWITILSEHYTLINSKEQLRYIKMVAKMEALNIKINVVKGLCETLRLWYDEKLVNCLKGWGYKLAYSPDNLLPDIEKTLTRIGNDEFKLTKMRHEYDMDQKHKKKKGEVASKNSFMKILYNIEKHRQQRYAPDKLTVYEFDMFCNELVEYNEAIEEQNKKVTEDKYRKK